MRKRSKTTVIRHRYSVKDKYKNEKAEKFRDNVAYSI
jgi:hypothetical protein